MLNGSRIENDSARRLNLNMSHILPSYREMRDRKNRVIPNFPKDIPRLKTLSGDCQADFELA